LDPYIQRRNYLSIGEGRLVSLLLCLMLAQGGTDVTHVPLRAWRWPRLAHAAWVADDWYLCLPDDQRGRGRGLASADQRGCGEVKQVGRYMQCGARFYTTQYYSAVPSCLPGHIEQIAVGTRGVSRHVSPAGRARGCADASKQRSSKVFSGEKGFCFVRKHAINRPSRVQEKAAFTVYPVLFLLYFTSYYRPVINSLVNRRNQPPTMAAATCSPPSTNSLTWFCLLRLHSALPLPLPLFSSSSASRVCITQRPEPTRAVSQRLLLDTGDRVDCP
jgi:hypothetical protein